VEVDVDTVYNDIGIRTSAGAYWLLFVALVLGVTVDALFAARTHQYVTAFIAGIWMLGVTIGAVRALRTLATLPPDPVSQLAFRLTIAQIVSIVLLSLLLLP
jgi:hypothetical protein